MEFIVGESAIKYGDYIVISDIHIGFEESIEEKGYTIPDQTSNVVERLRVLNEKAKNLIILGDVKHNIFLNDKMKILLFLSKVSELFKKIIIVKGNHDGNIENYTKGYKNITVVLELLIRDTLFIHGHKYASKEVMSKAKNILTGHFHSAHKLKDHLGTITTRKTWAVYKFNNEEYFKKQKVKTSVKKVVGFPCFNAFFDGTGEKNGPYSKFLEKTDVLTLDLIKLV
ncbi:MAG: metallophosphoesterase [Nanoarchaeota archaeon]|nr:metallophosphoesterase [Nanoarchaeota archaeon]